MSDTISLYRCSLILNPQLCVYIVACMFDSTLSPRVKSLLHCGHLLFLRFNQFILFLVLHRTPTCSVGESDVPALYGDKNVCDDDEHYKGYNKFHIKV